MLQRKKVLLVSVLALSSVIMTGCKVGTDSLFVHPKDQGYEYEVTYDVMGGHINQMKERTVYYSDDSLLYQPSGTSGMLVAPKNGNKTLQGWYTKYTAEETASGTIYHFDEADRWDFDTEKITKDVAPDDKLTLYARWVMNPSINFVDPQGDEKEPLLQWSIAVGKALSRPTSTEPKKSGYTLIDYYSDPECTQKFKFGEVITEDSSQYDELGNAYITIYCKFIEGEFVRVKTVAQLQEIKDAPDQDYILANDIDLSKQEWTPITGFTGKFDGNGFTIKNMHMTVKNRATGIAARTADEVSFGLFDTLNGADIYDLTIEDAKITVDKDTNVSTCVGSLAGRTKNSNIHNCTFKNITFESNGSCTANLTAAYIAATDSSCKLVNTSSENITDNLKTSKVLEVLKDN